MKNTLLILSVWTCLLITACSTNKASNAVKLEKFPVTSPIVIDTVYHTDFVAEIQAVKNIELRAKVKGYLEQINVDEGKLVHKGQVLFRISSQEYQQEVLTSKALLANAIAESKTAELTAQNVKLLVDKNVVAKAELDMAKAKVEAMKAKIDEAESKLLSAKLRLSFTEIKAPFDGIIDRIPNKVGSLINEGTLLTTLSDNSQVFAYFKVSEKEYLDYRAKSSNEKIPIVSLILANNKLFPHVGTIETVEGEFDQSTGNIAFRARFDNPERLLKHGSSGKVRLTFEINRAMVIPQKATFEIQDKIYVYIVDAKGKVSMRSIVPKMRIPHLYILDQGLSTSDRIIYEGIQEVKEGTTVKAEAIPMRKILQNLSKDVL